MLAQTSPASAKRDAAPSTVAVLVNLAGFQAGWFACVLGAAHGVPWLGPLVAAPVLTWHLATARHPGRAALLLAVAALVGLGLDTLLIRAERIAFSEGVLLEGWAPYWMVCLWALFASTFEVSLRWLREKPVLAALFGALGGPLAYWAGARLGAATLLEPVWAGLLLVSLVYALATPLLMLLARELEAGAVEGGP
ncbi:MAG: membrane protein [Geminicoccaceae bacterium]|jgi:hypothetical protein|nr:MAG: membrane protein [Geminicoccaceae bacterium]